jgi:rhodanese-related sulfurtransferase
VEKYLIVAIAAPALFLLLRSRVAAEGALTPAEAASWIKEKKNLQIIDVRTEGEYAEGHIAGAKLIPVQEIDRRLAEIDKKKPVLLYCRSGHRSASALKILSDEGYPGAKHLAGGLNAWKDANLPVVK